MGNAIIQKSKSKLGVDHTGSPIVPKHIRDIEEGKEFSYNEQRMLKHRCEASLLSFTRFFFKKRMTDKFMVNEHHKLMCKTLQRVLDGEINRLIINVPPGYTKTELAVISFIANGLALNAQSKFIHVSYADSLAMLNSTMVRDVVTSEEFQHLWPMKLRSDSQAKKAWFNEQNGGLLAMSSGGTITGFRAGRMDKTKFTGAFIIDDPLKPDDAYSEVKRESVNQRFTGTFQSRLAHTDVPMIVIMQRLHEDDPTGFLLKGGTGEKWHHLCLGVETGFEEGKYPKDYTHGIPIEVDLPKGALWEYKHTQEQIKAMRKADPYTAASQYDQRPAPLGGGIFKTDWWKYYKSEVLPTFEYKIITGDTAQKTKEHNDYSVFQVWGKLGVDCYLIDQIRGKWESHDLKANFIKFWNKHYGTGQAQTVARLRCAYIEDKSSGTGLIQDISANTEIPIIPIPRDKDKVTRAMDMVPYIASGHVFLPEDAEWLWDYEDEFKKFTPMFTHKHDDQIDPTLDAIDILLRPDDNEVGAW